MLQYEYFFDLIKFYTVMNENYPKFFEDKQAKMGFAGLASLAGTVVSYGQKMSDSGTSMVLKVNKGDVYHIPAF